MQITRSQCETCKREVVNTYTSEGWITLSGSDRGGLMRSIFIKITQKRKEGCDIDRTKCVNPNRLDFCCIDCLVTYLQKLGARMNNEE